MEEGVNKNPTTKQDQHKAIEIGVANLFLEYGINITSVPEFTSTMIQSAGESRLHKMLFAEAPTQRYESFEHLCAAAKLQLPHHGPRYAQVNAKFKKLRTKQEQKGTRQIDVSQFALHAQFFTNADQSPATILQQYTPHSSGVILISSTDAEPWLQATNELAPDELALFIVGDLHIPNMFQHSRIHAPARDAQGRAVLLNGQLVQMGSKHIGTTATQDSITLNDIQVCSVTIWKDTVEPALWHRIAEAPVKTTKELLALEGHAGIMGKPWGRTFQKDGLTVDAAIATSMQFHCEMTKGPRFEAMLKRSGFNNIFVTPKDETGAPSKHWRVIWLSMTPLEIESKTTAISGTAGMIKGKKAIGLRVEEHAFAAAWRKLKPDVDPPDQRILAHVFKLQPLPLGLDHTILKTWGESQGWEIKPIKPLGAKQWIVSADKLPPSVLSFNGNPILCQQLPQRSDHSSSAIVAGPRSKAQTASKPNSSQPYVQQDCMHSEANPDPWMRWNLNQTAKHAKAKEDNRSTPVAVPFPESRTLAGPFADMFQQQDSRIKHVETMMAQMNESNSTHKQAVETQLQALDTRLTQHVNQTQSGFDHLQQENHNMQRSIADALGRQDERMAKSFDELKTLFMSTRGTKRKESRTKLDDEELASASE